MASTSDIPRVKVTFDQLKSAALKLERKDANARKDLEERRTPAGRGGKSLVQTEMRAASAARQSRVMSSCSVLAKAVQAAVTASTTSSLKVLSLEEQRELNTQRRLAKQGFLPSQARSMGTSSPSDAGHNRHQQAPGTMRSPDNSTGTHGILSRSAPSSVSVTPVKQSHSRKVSLSTASPDDSWQATPRQSSQRPRVRADQSMPGSASLFGRAFAKALVDHQPESEKVVTMTESRQRGSYSAVATRQAESPPCSPQDLRSRLNRGKHIASAGILASPAKPAGRGVRRHAASRANGDGSAPAPAAPIGGADVVSGSWRDEGEPSPYDGLAADEHGTDLITGLEITIKQKRKCIAPTPVTDMDMEVVHSPSVGNVTGSGVAKRKRTSSVVVRRS